MCDHFGFALPASETAARRFLSHHADCDLGGWRDVLAQYRAAKGRLIAALDPATGRVVIPVAPPDETPAERLGRLIALLHEYGKLVGDLALCVTEGDVKAGAVTEDSPLLTTEGVRKEMKLTRAMTAYLRVHGRSVDEAGALTRPMTADAASALVAAVAEKWNARARGHLALSANILDILTQSHCCAYTSCHEPKGQHAAGPQQYLADGYTLVAYYWETWRARGAGGETVPYKLWRQLIHLDLERRSAVFMRRYGSPVAEPVHKELRERVASLLHALTGGAAGEEPRWKIARRDEEHADYDPYTEEGASLAYRDAKNWHSYIRLEGGEPPRIELADAADIPCPACGSAAADWDPKNLVCDDCATPRRRCADCNDPVDEDDAVTYGDDYLCPSCYEADYGICARCDDVERDNDLTRCADDDRVCARCRDRHYTECAGCGGWHRDRDVSGGPDGSSYCTDCYEEHFTPCDGCDEDFDPDDLTRWDGSDYCADCHAERVGDCAECGDTCARDDLTKWEGSDYCADCLDARELECDGCGAELTYGESAADAPGELCEDCCRASARVPLELAPRLWPLAVVS